MMRRMRRLLMLCVAGVALAGCGGATITSKGKNTIKADLARQTGVPVTAVTCPGSVKDQKGYSFTCQATFQASETEPVEVTETGSNGGIIFRLGAIVALSVQSDIQQRLTSGGVKAAALCPQHQPITVGTSFACSLTPPVGAARHVKVTITSAAGATRLQLVR
jgi:hypothetical protein